MVGREILELAELVRSQPPQPENFMRVWCSLAARNFAIVQARVQIPSRAPKVNVYSGRMSKCLALAAVAALLVGCSSAPENRIEATIRNDTPVPLVIRISTPYGPLVVTIPPKTTWSGGLDRRLIPARVEAVVEIPGAPK